MPEKKNFWPLIGCLITIVGSVLLWMGIIWAVKALLKYIGDI